MRILVVSSFPPCPCGIRAYARDHVSKLRTEGHQVTVLSPPDGHGDVRAPFLGDRAFRTAARMGSRFDRWVAAADRIVLPNRRSWSSGVLARAHALGTPAIVPAVGGLGEQAGPSDDVVDDDDGALLRAVRQAAQSVARLRELPA
jgi:hypothetical protein